MYKFASFGIQAVPLLTFNHYHKKHISDIGFSVFTHLDFWFT